MHSLSPPPPGPVEWVAFPRSCETLAERLASCVRVECQHAQQAWTEGARLLGLLREQVDVCRADRLRERAA